MDFSSSSHPLNVASPFWSSPSVCPFPSTCFLWEILWLLTTTTCLLMISVFVTLVQSSLLRFRYTYPTCLILVSIDCHTDISKSINWLIWLKLALFSQNSVTCIHSAAKVRNLRVILYSSFKCLILFILPYKYCWTSLSTLFPMPLFS